MAHPTHITAPLIITGYGAETDNNSLLFGAGTASDRMTTATANKKFIEFRLENTATSGDNRGIYNRLYLGGAGGGGESLRSFTSVDDVAVGTAHGAHISLNFESSGTVTGLGAAIRGTLHIPDDASQAGTLTALQAEIYSDGTLSDTAGGDYSYFRVVNDGDAVGIANVDDDVFLMSLQGFTAGSGHIIDNSDGSVDKTLKFTNVVKFKIKVGTTTYYIPAAQTIGAST